MHANNKPATTGGACHPFFCGPEGWEDQENFPAISGKCPCHFKQN